MKAALALCAALLAGCAAAPMVETIVIDESSAPIRAKVLVLPAGTPHSSVQPVIARSCQVMNWEPAASNEDAIAQLQIKASRLGANALIGVSCKDEKGSEFRTNCWTSVLCTGQAAKIQ